MAPSLPASEASLRYVELHSPSAVPCDVKTTSLVEELVSKKFNEKLEALQRRRSTRRSTRGSSRTTSTSESAGEELNDEVFPFEKAAKPTSESDDSDDSGEARCISSNESLYPTSSFFGSLLEEDPPSLPEAAPEGFPVAKPTSESDDSDDGGKARCISNESLYSASSFFGSLLEEDPPPSLPEAAPEGFPDDTLVEVPPRTTTGNRYPRPFRATSKSSMQSGRSKTNILNTHSKRTWPLQEDLEREVEVTFQKLFDEWKKAVDMKTSEEGYHYRANLNSPDPKLAADDVIITLQTLSENGAFDRFLSESDSRALFVADYNLLQISPYKSNCLPTFLIVKKIKISELAISYTEPSPPHSRSYTFGVLDSGYQIYQTEIQVYESEDVAFESEYDFENLPYDFEIRLQFFRHNTTGRLIKQGCLPCFTKHENEEQEEQGRPLFKSIGEVALSCEHLRDCCLNQVHQSDVGKLYVTAKVSSKVYSQLRISDYLYYVSTEKKPTVGWTSQKRWCQLEHTYIKMWLSHEMADEPPVKRIDLTRARCVRRALPEENPRQYSIVIEYVEKDHCVKKYFFSHNREEGIELWGAVIRIVKAVTESFSS